MSFNTLTKPSALAFAALLAFAAPSCKKSDVAAPAASTPAAVINVNNEQVETLRQFISSTTGEQNVTWSAATNTFIIDGDAAMSLEEAQEHYDHKDQQGAASTENVQHRKAYYTVALSKASVIKVYADATVPAVWRAALVKSIANWNATNSRLFITLITTPTGANTVVTAANTGATGTIALTNYPDYNSNPGRKVTINSYYNYLAAGLQTFAITHELGHAFGFGHTNSTYGTLVPGTPNTEGGSIMNSVCLTWSAFTTYDLLAIRTVYPR